MLQLVYLHNALRRFYYGDRLAHATWWSAATWFPKVAVLIVFVGNSLFVTMVYSIGGAIALARL